MRCWPPDPKVQNYFLDTFGRPLREIACECERSSNLQLGPVMALVSGPTVGDAISETLPPFDFGRIALPPKSLQLNEVVIYAFKDPVYYKGDTLVYTADSFKDDIDRPAAGGVHAALRRARSHCALVRRVACGEVSFSFV